jgi:hypothetical protein
MAAPARKGSLIGAMAATKAQVAAEPAVPPPIVNRSSDEMTTTAIHIPKATLALLRRVAVERANLHGGRPSVSAVLADLVEQHRAELERELHRG